MSYLKDYLFYNSGNECPENFHIFGALGLVSSVINRKVYIDWPPNRIYTNLYILLVGDQGSRKGVAKSCMYNALVQHFPAVPRGASTTTPQAITKRLASSDCTVAFRDENDIVTNVHAITFCISEFKHFLGINMSGMIDLLTDAYDEVYIEADYKNTGNDPIERPYIVLLACETPDWVLERMKNTIISGGFARRLIPVFEKSIRMPIPTPYVTPDMQAAMDRCITKLKSASTKVGKMGFTPEAKEYYEKWYMAHFKRPPSDPLMKGFHSSHHTQLLKIACLLTLVDREEMLLTVEYIQLAQALLERVLPGMEELFKGAGRNVLALPTQRILQWLQTKGGKVLEKELRMFGCRDMDPRELESTILHLQRTEQIVLTIETTNNVSRRMVLLKGVADILIKDPPPVEQKPAEPPSAPPPPTSSGSSPEVGPPSGPS